MSAAFHPAEHYLHLRADGASATVAGGEKFWSLPPASLEAFGSGWLITEYGFATDWPTWEMHPQGDEFAYLLAGEVTLILEQENARQAIELAAPRAIVIPKGAWHTMHVRKPARMLFVTRGGGTVHRSA